MKNIKKIILAVLCCYLMIGCIFIAKIYIVHQIHKDGLPVLGYHSVVEDTKKEVSHDFDPYVISRSAFVEQMQYLYDNGYQTLSMDEVYAYYMGDMVLDKPAVVLTFDDGLENFNSIVKPILKEYGFHATAFVIGNKTKQKNNKYLKQEDLVADANVSYYSHSYNLHRFAKIPQHKIIEIATLEEIQQDFKQSQGVIDTTYFAYPYGVSSANALQALAQNHTKLAFSFNNNRNMNPKDPKYLLPRYFIFSSMPLWYFKWIVE